MYRGEARLDAAPAIPKGEQVRAFRPFVCTCESPCQNVQMMVLSRVTTSTLHSELRLLSVFTEANIRISCLQSGDKDGRAACVHTCGY